MTFETFLNKFVAFDLHENARIELEDLFKNVNMELYNGMVVPTYINYMELRITRQNVNNKLVVDAIINNDMTLFNKCTNANEVERVVRETGSDLGSILSECRNSTMMMNILAGRISINASRQGSKDEVLQIKTCDTVSQKFDTRITKLTSTAFRPTKAGDIISKDDMKNMNIKKDECLKSFDARITGKINGWVFAKVVYTHGGHQDNVFEEADVLCDWVCKFKSDSEELFVILIDTDLQTKFQVLKEKYENTLNLLIVNHYEFQQYLIAKMV